MRKNFSIHPKLKIPVPHLTKPWHMYSAEDKEEILNEWENIRGTIPDYVQSYEKEIENKLALLEKEENIDKSSELNHEISELASMINELWIYYRKEESIY